MKLDLCPKCKAEVENYLAEWLSAYPPHIFPDLTDDDKKRENNQLVTRASAGMARQMIGAMRRHVAKGGG